MTAKPATPLPWYVGNHPSDKSGTEWREILTDATPFNPSYIGQALGLDAAYIVHACNNLPRAIEGLRVALMHMDARPKDEGLHVVRQMTRALLRDLGEAQS